MGQGELLELVQLGHTSQGSTHVAGVFGRGAGVLLTTDEALHTVAGEMAALTKLRQSLVHN